MKVLCNDGKIRELIPVEGGFCATKLNQDYGSLSKSASMLNRNEAYCYHCRQKLGFIDVKSDEARKHACNKLYKNENNKKRYDKGN
jgi:hypothetical protein